MAKREKYGLMWDDCDTDVEIELFFVKHKGYYNGKGEGLYAHHSRAQRLIWPELDVHRWSELILKELCRKDHKVTSLMGPGSCAKTHEASKWGLVEYFADPERTCVLVSSTDIRGLKMRVWGEICSLWKSAIERWSFLGGHMLESRIAITTDDLDDGDLGNRSVRDMRKAIVGVPCIQDKKFVGLAKFHGIKQKRLRLLADECFPAGTMVNTPFGLRAIESIKSGDLVVSATGVNKVKRSISKTSKQLVRITSKSGRVVECTPEHPFFTQKGWIKACNLCEGHFMLGEYETMSILQGNVPESLKGSRMQAVPGETLQEGVQRLREVLSSEMDKRPVHFLQSSMRQPIPAYGPRVSEEVLHGVQIQEYLEYPERTLQKTSRGSGASHSGHFGEVQEFSGFYDIGAEVCLEQGNQREKQTIGVKADCAWRKRNWSNKGRMAAYENVSGCYLEPSGKDRHEGWERLPDLLQTGLGVAEFETGNRGGWFKPLKLEQSEAAGRKEAEILRGDWVDRVEMAQQGDYGLQDSGQNHSGCRVYNLEVEGHPSYSVNGFIVHNCSMMSSNWLKSFANLNNNEDFQAVCCFNPNDPMDPGGVVSEPKDGWSKHMEPSKTECWDTRFMNGRCVNLIGTDSPNFDDPLKPNRYPYLIGPKKIEELVSAFGKDSFEYHTQAVGSMKTGTLSRRVLTIDACRTFRALEDVVWKNSNRTRVYALDASYGGDRCVGGWAEFGLDVNDQTILALHPPSILPVSPKREEEDKEPEDQIAERIKQDCTTLNIPPENMGHDSTGRGSLGSALARVWSNMCNPIEFGGSPSERPVNLDFYIIDDKTRQRRLKLCNEHYDRKVSELWYSIRYAVESEQVRNLPPEVMEELCMRTWDLVKNKISVEPKSSNPQSGRIGMKERTGRSPDLGDWCALIVEMARRRGFSISKLANDEDEERSNEWLRTLEHRQRLFQERHQLQYSQ